MIAMDKAKAARQAAVLQHITAYENAGRSALASKAVAIHENDRRMIERSLKELRPAFDELAKLVDPFGYEAIRRMVMAAFSIGVGAAFTDSAKKLAQKAQAGAAQTGNSERAAIRKAELRKAILQAAGKAKLIGSLKFADALHKKVCEVLGVELNGRGYSSRTIQREIGAILEERTKS